MQPQKKQRLTTLENNSSRPLDRYLSSSTSSSSIPPASSSEIDEINLTSAPSSPTTASISISQTTTASASISQTNVGKSSYIWNHGTKTSQNGKDRWQCSLCRQSYALSGSSTTNQREHLKSHHGIYDSKEPVDTRQSNIDNYQRPPIRLDILRKLIVEWIVDRRHSFNETQSEALRKIFEYLDPRSTKALMSAKTTRRDVTNCFQIAKTMIKERLSLARSRIHISYDLWTSPNHKAMIAIVAHWMGEDYKVKTALLAVKEVYGEHTGSSIADIVYPVMKEYDIHRRFGYFVGDNATNNDTSLQHLDSRMREEGYDGFEPENRRLRCFAHEMQIAVKGLLFGPNVKELEEYPATAEVTEKEKLEYEKKKWRAFGAIGKLHNVVKYIRGSPQRREAYSKSIVREQLEKLAKKKLKVPVMDNDTRWGSVMDMVDYARENRQYLHMYCLDTAELDEDRLTDQDWIDLDAVTMLLKPFRLLTSMGQEKNTPLGSIGSVLWGFDMLLEVLENTRKNYNIEKPTKNNKNSAARQKLSHIATCIDHAHGLFSKYYKFTDRTEAYVVAMVLDPRQKYAYFEHHWDPVHLPGVYEKTETMYREFCKVDDDAGTSLSTATDSQQNRKRKAKEELEFDIEEFRFGKEEAHDELEQYLKTPKLTLPNQEANCFFDVIGWWKANEAVYPTLARIAFEVYSIPSMSAEVERVFSSAKLTLSDRRNRLATESVESVECLHNWRLSGLIEGVIDQMDLKDLIEMDAVEVVEVVE